MNQRRQSPHVSGDSGERQGYPVEYTFSDDLYSYIYISINRFILYIDVIGSLLTDRSVLDTVKKDSKYQLI